MRSLTVHLSQLDDWVREGGGSLFHTANQLNGVAISSFHGWNTFLAWIKTSSGVMVWWLTAPPTSLKSGSLACRFWAKGPVLETSSLV